MNYKKTVTPEHRIMSPQNREELMRRLEINRQRKQVFVERAKEILRKAYKERTGQEPEGFEVW